MLQRLSSRGLNISNEEKWTPMHFAVLGGNPEAVRYLISQDVGVNNRTVLGQSPLHFAAQAGNEFLIAILVENGAILDSQDNQVFFLF
ncbi:ankyrin repeat-containing protein [Tritrichomonas foetus]|uniref:Ankyrin repeat-containing protein n=1 Tax=Tritrichomonas foetus TaxID=1144522 RepID=A0A1J4KCI7_9EUKA|nr:ankyrin repeat-containing protein [Tritrichomonas foetus]|eukprot:OHT09137.1 ankyrin repeat-containing protein [Tritrichomonas foetus]